MKLLSFVWNTFVIYATEWTKSKSSIYCYVQIKKQMFFSSANFIRIFQFYCNTLQYLRNFCTLSYIVLKSYIILVGIVLYNNSSCVSKSRYSYSFIALKNFPQYFYFYFCVLITWYSPLLPSRVINLCISCISIRKEW